MGHSSTLARRSSTMPFHPPQYRIPIHHLMFLTKLTCISSALNDVLATFFQGTISLPRRGSLSIRLFAILTPAIHVLAYTRGSALDNLIDSWPSNQPKVNKDETCDRALHLRSGNNLGMGRLHHCDMTRRKKMDACLKGKERERLSDGFCDL